MKLSPLFKLSPEPTPALIQLLDEVTLGTNGAKYRHLNTEERIHKVDHPLHLSIERKESLLGNATFCQRGKEWYVRYFAFNPKFQGVGTKKSKSKDGFLKRELEHFFQEVLSGSSEFGEVNSFFAYIDPNNEKSLWMSENFGFETKAKIATQSFSRSRPKKQQRVEKIDDWEQVKTLFQREYQSFHYYTESHVNEGPYFIIRDENNEIIAATKSYKAQWEIERLPGKLGGILIKLIPFIPVLRKLIRPKNHSFLVPEAVFVKDHNSKVLAELFEGMLAIEREHLILWWTDEKNPIYQKSKNEIKWGLLHKIIGVNCADVVVRQSKSINFDKSKPVYTCGFDFI